MQNNVLGELYEKKNHPWDISDENLSGEVTKVRLIFSCHLYTIVRNFQRIILKSENTEGQKNKYVYLDYQIVIQNRLVKIMLSFLIYLIFLNEGVTFFPSIYDWK